MPRLLSMTTAWISGRGGRVERPGLDTGAGTAALVMAMALVMALAMGAAWAAPAVADPAKGDPFASLEGDLWPSPNAQRTASGRPGPAYWQQKVDYRIEARLDEASREIRGRAEIVYHNNSPDALDYLWLSLDQNRFRRDSIAETSTVHGDAAAVSAEEAARIRRMRDWNGGFADLKAFDADGRPLPFSIADTLMRVDLPRAAAPGEQVRFSLEWRLPLVETAVVGGRGGYECFEGAAGDCIFVPTQWFPRLAVYSDYEGWHTRPFLEQGEFAQEFGDFEVALTVPADHVVAATGELTNAAEVLSAAQRARLDQARSAAAPVYVVTPDEARAAQAGRAGGERTWRFRAEKVRDFVFASSRKFIWDAMGVAQDDAERPLVMAMSFYPLEASPLWDQYSTPAVAHALKAYGAFAFPYPYPVAQAVFGPVDGMEYPMLIINDPRPTPGRDGGPPIVSPTLVNTLVEVHIHEIGHIWFPMIVNSDEREWSWLDEGLNSFVQYQAEKQWRADFPSRFGGPPRDIASVLAQPGLQPIMTQPDSQRRYFSTTYTRPATALNVLRTSVLGPERFDRAFAEYSRSWRFKRATPTDFFRAMEDGSGADLDWFWRAWFYGDDSVDVALEGLTRLEAPEDLLVYQLTFRNIGGMVSPLSLRIDFEDGTHEAVTIPADIWRLNPTLAHWRYVADRPVAGARLDYDYSMADSGRANNARTLKAAAGGS